MFARHTLQGPGECIPLAYDLASQAACEALATDLSKRIDALHVLINNAGTTWGEPMASYPEQAWEKVFSLNVKSIFCLTRACLPLLDRASTAEDPARVINIGSITGITPQPVPTYAYDASKAAVHLLTRKLAAEFADRSGSGGTRICVNAIAPGFVPSKMSAQLSTYAPASAIASGIPLGRMGTPEDMAGAAVYLSSRAGAWVTGHVLAVDGGSLGAQPITFDIDTSKL